MASSGYVSTVAIYLSWSHPCRLLGNFLAPRPWHFWDLIAAHSFEKNFWKVIEFYLFNGSNQNLQCGTLSDSDSFIFLYLDGFFMSISSNSPLTLVLSSQSSLWGESRHVQKKYPILSESSTSFGAALYWGKKNLISWMIGMWSK